MLPEKSAWLYANVSDIKNLVGDELVASAIKSAMAELGPNEVTNRTKIEPLAQQKLAESLVQKYGEDVVFVNKVVINDMNFEDAYNEAIQQKSIAQQNADNCAISGKMQDTCERPPEASYVPDYLMQGLSRTPLIGAHWISITSTLHNQLVAHIILFFNPVSSFQVLLSEQADCYLVLIYSIQNSWFSNTYG